MKKTVTVLLAALLIFVMGACGNSGDTGSASTAATGTYKITSMTMEGQTFTAEELQANGQDITDSKLEIKEGGEFSLVLLAGGENETVSGTWTEDGNKISLTSDGVTMEATLDGNKMTLSQNGAEMTFEK